ncbi:hypothetical protein BDZ90DRAFT_230965 [Jaminaea rosea]|uniref:Uncharacterized protein n=1 Tax=Jaminaea rosea TaxID=1569628 RepID=A0A316V0K1_9BASI|nr:hypothetical protein BDZ90DRAFT_230965 [Jaminaea rosea]PWN28965.1 hypothetical protein BDZ90DRAFT_230965 [Jaminaea rosea]
MPRPRLAVCPSWVLIALRPNLSSLALFFQATLHFGTGTAAPLSTSVTLMTRSKRELVLAAPMFHYGNSSGDVPLSLFPFYPRGSQDETGTLRSSIDAMR